jgi:site-specific recombinase XerD
VNARINLAAVAAERGIGLIASENRGSALRHPPSRKSDCEMEPLLASPDVNTTQGCRDRALLLFLDHTGARADEAAHVLIGDLQLGLTPERDLSVVLLRGKGNKLRRCPLWAKTM